MSEVKGEIKKMMIILSKATLENVYAAFVLANGARSEGIEAEMFFTFFGLEAINKSKLEHLHIATVGNPAMHMPTMLGGLPGMEALATSMMKKEMEKIDMPDVHEFLDILKASGVKLRAAAKAHTCYLSDTLTTIIDSEWTQSFASIFVFALRSFEWITILCNTANYSYIRIK
jgi:peroxiredoxin family protein